MHDADKWISLGRVVTGFQTKKSGCSVINIDMQPELSLSFYRFVNEEPIRAQMIGSGFFVAAFKAATSLMTDHSSFFL